MTNLVFLEAAAQSDSAAEIIESNEALINFATAEVDSLVEEQALHTAWHVGAFVEESFDITYENVTDPVSDIVIEATSVFADVIASDVSDSEKKELIEGYAHIIAMGDSELIAEARFGRKVSRSARDAKRAFTDFTGRTKASKFDKFKNKVTDKLTDVGDIASDKMKIANKYGKGKKDAMDKGLRGMSKNKAIAAGAGAGGLGGGAAGGLLGGAIGAFASMFSKERKVWKALVKQEKMAHKKGANAATLSKIQAAKSKARDAYMKARGEAAKKGAKLGGIAGAVGGAVAGGVYGKRANAG